MSRTGFISTNVAIRQLTAVIGDGQEATRLICDALEAGSLTAKGRRQLPDPPPQSTNSAGRMALRPITGTPIDEPPAFDELKAIQPSFWLTASEADRRNWDLKRGVVMVAADAAIYEDVRISEKDFNAFVDVHQARLQIDKAKLTRARRADWADWIVALAILTWENAITPGMKIGEVLHKVDDRLEDWSLESTGMSPSTLNPVVERLLARLAG